MMNNKPTLLTYLNGLPDVESIYPILVTLNNRAKINIKVIVYSKLLRKEPRLVEAFQKYNLFPIKGSKFSMKFAFWKDINKADAILTISDPNFDTTTRKQRSYYIKKIQKKSVFVQHGVYQIGVNEEPTPGQSINYYSSKLLLWESMKERVGISDASKNKSAIIGFVKKRLTKPLQYDNEVKVWDKGHRQKLLICHSFRWGRGRFKDSDVYGFYNMIEDLAKRNPDLGIIIRSHRGKVRRLHRKIDNELEKKYPNILFSRHYHGPLAGATIHDVIDLCDAMISPTSTTVLDCIYQKKPAAIFNEGLSIFNELPVIDGIDDIESFLETVKSESYNFEKIYSRFGDMEENLNKAAEIIENELLNSINSA
jgi:hypothetical protein